MFPLSRSQRVVLCLAGLAILAMCLYPPYTITWPCSGSCEIHDIPKGQIHTVTWRYWIWDRPDSELTVEARLSPSLFVLCLTVALTAGLWVVAIAQRQNPFLRQ